MAITLNGSSPTTFSHELNFPNVGRRNWIINGDMQVAQRGTSSTGITGTGDGYKTVDRWFLGVSTDTGSINMEQSTDAPAGFNNSVKLTSNTQDVPSGTEYSTIEQRIEVSNAKQLAYGTSSAQYMTLSFWVKSAQAGTLAGYFYADSSTRANRFTYTINSADTWEYKTIVVSPDSVDGLTGTYLNVTFYVSASSVFKNAGWDEDTWQSYSYGYSAYGMDVDIMSTAGNYVAITGVQLELGSVATPFEHRSYGEELALCQRYFERIGGDANYSPIGVGSQRTTQQTYFNVYFKQIKRASPTVSFSGNVIVTDRKNYDQVVTSITESVTSVFGFHGRFEHSAVGADYRPHHVTSGSNGSGHMDFDAEL